MYYCCLSDVDGDKSLRLSTGREVSSEANCSRLQTSSVTCRDQPHHPVRDRHLPYEISDYADEPVNMTTARCRRRHCSEDDDVRSNVDVVASPILEQHRRSSTSPQRSVTTAGSAAHSAAAAAPTSTSRIWSVVELIQSNDDDDSL